MDLFIFFFIFEIPSGDLRPAKRVLCLRAADSRASGKKASCYRFSEMQKDPTYAEQ